MHLKDLVGSIARLVLCLGPGFLSSATWPSLSKKHYNGLINLSINQSINLSKLYHLEISKNEEVLKTKAECLS